MRRTQKAKWAVAPLEEEKFPSRFLEKRGMVSRTVPEAPAWLLLRWNDSKCTRWEETLSLFTW